LPRKIDFLSRFCPSETSISTLQKFGYENKAPEFYRAYQNARKAVKLGIRHNDDDEDAPDSNIAE
jgi:hypothetical protein